MTTQLEQEFSADLVLVSDIHIREPDDQRATMLLELCQRVERGRVANLVLLGDIFDFYLGRHRYFQKRFAAISEALERVAASGTRVVYFEGNHEFDLKQLPLLDVQVVTEGDLVLTMPDGAKILMAHGDLVYSHRVYRAFRRLVKSWIVRFVAGLFPGRFVERFALGNAHVSRAADEYRVLRHEEILATVNRWADGYDCNHAIFGHLHHPYFAARRDKPGFLISLHSWEAPNVLVYKNERFWRVYMEPASPWVLEAAEMEDGSTAKTM